MEETGTECSMCGDVGFPDKLFQCIRCRSRFQHSYCSNYYQEQPTETSAGVCDWCLSADRRHGAGGSPKKADSSHGKRSECPGGDKVATRGGDNCGDSGGTSSRGKGGSGSSSKPTTRRYKLLKDVLC